MRSKTGSVCVGILISIFILSGCVNLKVEEPLLTVDNGPSRARPFAGEPEDSQAKIQWLRGQLERCRNKLDKVEDEKDELEDQLDDCEDRLDR